MVEKEKDKENVIKRLTVVKLAFHHASLVKRISHFQIQQHFHELFYFRNVTVLKNYQYRKSKQEIERELLY